MPEIKEETLQYLAKSIDVLNHGVAAWVEVMEKSEEASGKLIERLEKYDVEDKEKEEEEKKKAEAEKEALVKAAEDKARTESITKAVIEAISKQMFQGLDVDGKTMKKVDGGDVTLPAPAGWPMNKRGAGEDQEKPASLKTETAEVQKPIQAMHQGIPHHDESSHTPAMAPVEGGAAPQYPTEEEEEKEVPNLDQMRAMQNQLLEMQKMMSDLKKSTDVAIKKGVETELKKMGIHQEISSAPKINAIPASRLGAQENPLIKSENSGDLTLEQIQKDQEVIGNTDWNSLIKFEAVKARNSGTNNALTDIAFAGK